MKSKKELKDLVLKAKKLNKIGIVSNKDLRKMIYLYDNHNCTH